MYEKKIIVSIILIFAGALLFLGNYIPIFNISILWPIIIIIIGLGLMFRDLYHS